MRIFEKFLAVLVVMAFGGSVLPALVANGSLPSGLLDAESPGVTILYASVYVIILSLVLMRRGLAWRMMTVNPALSALLLLAFVSAAWSIFPDVTFRRSVALLFTMAFGLYLGLRYRLEEAVAVLTIGIGLLVLLSFVFIAVLPDIGIDQDIHRGAWKGVFFQKNVTGRMVAWFALGLVWLDRVGYGRKLWLRGGLVMALALLIMSRSGTGLVTTGLMTVIVLSARGLRSDVRTLLPTLALLSVIALVAAVAVTVNFKDTMYMLGRDTTLTGRTEIWAFGRSSIADNPVLGYGYAAFWYGLYGPASYYITQWNITSIHNGWLEVMLDLGLPGLVAMLALMGRLLFGSVLTVRYGDHRKASWLLAATLALLALSISESVFLERHSINAVVFALALVHVSAPRRHARQPAESHGWQGKIAMTDTAK